MRGAYLILMKLINSKEIEIGKLGKIKFKKGYYIYVGSAMNSIKSRTGRYLRGIRKKKWHIDYFIEHTSLLYIVEIASDKRIEAALSNLIESFEGVPIRGFGNTDLKEVPSNLYYFKKKPEDLVENVRNNGYNVAAVVVS